MENAMRLRTILPVAIAVIAICLMVSPVLAGISGSKHDFGTAGWAKNEICLPCHTPHNAVLRDAAGAVIQGPLWNHTLSNATYVLYYDPDTGTPVQGAVDQNSKLCLSCHDGTVALDSFGGVTGNTFISGSFNVGTDLGNDHPIGEAAIWPTPNPAYLVDPALRTAAGIMPLRRMADNRLAVGCTSCHEPHNRKNQENMLWVKNNGPGTTVDNRAVTGSLLCMNCHKK
jgi:nitrate/TMAO reductase-like tetraheme cytochrome c subunit